MVLPLAVLGAYLVFAILIGLCGSQRRMGFTGTFLLSVALTPVIALNSSVSCESRAVPEYQPDTERRPMINESALTDRGSKGAPGTSRFPFTDNPSTSAEIAGAFGAVARITRAPRSFCNCAAASPAPEST